MTTPDPIVDPDTLFAELEADRASGELRKKVLGKGYGYQSSKAHPDLLEKVDVKGNILALGVYRNGDFVEVDPASHS